MTKTESSVNHATQEYQKSPEFKKSLHNRDFGSLVKQTAQVANAAYVATVITSKERKDG